MIRIEVVGQGMIESCLQWDSTAVLNAGGRFSFSMPAEDPAAAWITPLAQVRCYWRHELVGAGIVDNYAINEGPTGSVLTINGDDMARELATRTVSYANSTDAHTIVDDIGTILPAGWTFVDDVTPPTAIVAQNVMRDSLLNMIVTLCDMAGLWFVIDGLTLKISNSLGAVKYGIEPTALTREIDSYDVVTKIYPFGAGEGMAALKIKPGDLAAPTGFSFDTTNNAVTNTASTYPLRERRVDFKQIAPLANTDAGVVAAANTLRAAAIQYLRDHAEPITSYRAQVLYTGRILPLDRVAVCSTSPALSVTADLVATEVQTRITPNELVTLGLTLSTNARRILSDSEVIADGIRVARILGMYPQLLPGLDTVYGAAEVTTDADSSVRLLFHADVTQVEKVTIIADMQSAPQVYEGGYAYTPVQPASLQVRANGSGSWTTISDATDITSLLVNATTKRPLQMNNTLNLHGVAPANTLSPLGTIKVDPATLNDIPSGSIVRALQAMPLFSTRLETVWAEDATLIATIPAGSRVYKVTSIALVRWDATTTALIADPTGDWFSGSSVPGLDAHWWWSQVRYNSLVGWTPLYCVDYKVTGSYPDFIRTSTVQNNPYWSTADFIGRLQVQLHALNITQAVT